MERYKNIVQFLAFQIPDHLQRKRSTLCKPPTLDAYKAFKNMFKAISSNYLTRGLRTTLRWDFKSGTYF